MRRCSTQSWSDPRHKPCVVGHESPYHAAGSVPFRVRRRVLFREQIIDLGAERTICVYVLVFCAWVLGFIRYGLSQGLKLSRSHRGEAQMSALCLSGAGGSLPRSTK